MTDIKLVLWNMEWMNDLFLRDDKGVSFRPDKDKTPHDSAKTVKERRDSLTGVLDELKPDVVVIIEGPGYPEELQLFFDNMGEGKWITSLQEPIRKSQDSEKRYSQSQNIGIAVRIDTGIFKDPAIQAWDSRNESYFSPFLIDTDNDEIKEQHRFDRMPLYVEIRPSLGLPFRVLGLHLKSKGIFGAYEWSKWWEMADANRKKILAQAAHIHDKFIEPYLSNKETKGIPLIVCGDINDGPGLDASEKRLFSSGIERLMGSIWQPETCLGNALFDSLKTKAKTEMNFSSLYTTKYRDPIFNGVTQEEWIDHILYSRTPLSRWAINGKVNRTLPDGSDILKKYKHASDHYPVSVEIKTVNG